MSADEWTVGAVAETVDGGTLLRMTERQAEALRDLLVDLLDGGDWE